MATMIARFLPMSDAERTALDRFLRPTLRNWNGIEVGGLRAADFLSSSRASEGRPGNQ